MRETKLPERRTTMYKALYDAVYGNVYTIMGCAAVATAALVLGIV